jgi:hypothetical protein
MKWRGMKHAWGEERCIQCLMEKPEGPRHVWEADIKMDLQEVGWGVVWIDLA